MTHLLLNKDIGCYEILVRSLCWRYNDHQICKLLQLRKSVTADFRVHQMSGTQEVRTKNKQYSKIHITEMERQLSVRG